MSNGVVSPTVNDRISLENCKTVDALSVCRQISLFVKDMRLLKIISTQVNSERN
ncbi:hypothetical protein [Nostoc sp. UHCC 0251]|uniref:hypothetical protein n=1 Tax=Nostoc sp. UHCC 0251 TaxID=3110240 RepID=UPI002B2063F8|nr:hypothetical protein [Nostoc sp. UHCC 0251]MEA5623857.1 hypothetical protein [Nostoc sp. UHCC 0251]